MKGVSTIIATVLVLLILVALASIAYVWFTTVFTKLSESAANQTGIVSGNLKASMVMESENDHQIFVRNTGNVDLSGFNVYFNDVLASPTLDKQTVKPSEILTITFSNYLGEEGGNKIKITNAQNLVLNTDFSLHFYDDFNDGNDDSWNRISSPNNIAVVNGEYRFNTSANSRIDDENFADFTIEYKIKHSNFLPQ